MRIPLLLVLCFISFQVLAQRLENIRAEAVNGGERVIITYDLTGASSDQKYNVSVYSSHNNYSTSLAQLSGDIHDVTPGKNKRIEWNARGEMVEYNGDITFELRADAIAVPLTVKTPTGVKKGKSTTVTYSGVIPGESTKLELIKGGVVVSQIGSSNDPSKYTWSVPIDVEKAGDYQIKLTSGARTTTSGPFAIKAKSKTWMIVVPAVVVTGVIVFLVTKPKKSDGGTTPGSKDLPTPPEP